MKTYQQFTKNGETFLREKNPYQYGITVDEDYNMRDFEQTALSEAKVLINPVDGKDVYLDSELKDVWQYKKPKCDYWITSGWNANHPDYPSFNSFETLIKKMHGKGTSTRQAFEYIGDTHPLDGVFEKEDDDGFFGLVDSVIEFRDNNPQSEYTSPVQAERNRITGIIEAEIKTGDIGERHY